MKGVLGNSCAKGCMVYVVALVIIVAITAFGLGGLKAKFGASNQGPQINAQRNGPSPSSFGIASPQAQQAAPQQTAGSGTGDSANGVTTGSYSPAPTPVPAQPAQPVPPVQPNVPPTRPTPQSTPQAFTPVESQGGVISGEASAPFYVVQPGDTLWEISRRFGVDVGALRVINNLSADNTIYPGQTLILAQGGMSQQVPHDGVSNSAAPNDPAANSTGSTSSATAPGSELPSMPDTGINRKP